MYLRSIRLKNIGPIKEFDLSLPFDGKRPKVTILVGRNGTGKSTVISNIVNALVGIKQMVYENAEVEKGRVYKLRSPLQINGNAEFSFAKIGFDRGLSLIEWQLNKQKQDFADAREASKVDRSWQSIPPQSSDHFELPVGELNQPHLLEGILENTTLLFFPADRFEPPDWLNSEDLSSELKLPEPLRIKGKTERRIFSRNRLKPTLEWFNSVVFDTMVLEHGPLRVPFGEKFLDARVPTPGRAHAVFNSVHAVLTQVLCQSPEDQLSISITDRRSRILSATVVRNGQPIRHVNNLLSLSAGESALFCLFASIVRDADLSSMQFQGANEIKGIVIIDEADLHLHFSMQYEVLPRLVALFPQVQFIMSLHSPMLTLGLGAILGEDGIEIREMPSGQLVTPESYSEFRHAFDAFTATKKFEEEIKNKLDDTELPAVLVEGKTDASHLSVAWNKLFPQKQMPFDIIPCGVEANPEQRTGGSDSLRRCAEYLAIVSDRPIIAIFDNDRAGNESFNALNGKAFDIGKDASHKKHKAKSIHAILLPAPEGREDFVASSKASNRYLSIEHYFSDKLLRENGFETSPVLPGTKVFEIDAKGRAKTRFSDAIQECNPEEFIAFGKLFEYIHRLVTA